jgi:streptogramin lyase/ASC-1-like (ASCH) protein
VGTTDGGLNKFDREDYFDHYKSDPNNPNSLSDNFVYAIYEDHLGNLWIGTNSNGVNKFDRKTDTFTHYRNIPGDPSSLSSNFIRMIYEDRAGVIWIGTTGGGLNRFNRQTETFTSYQRIRNDSKSLSSNVVRTIYEDRSGNFWVGTTGSGLDKMDRKTGTFTHYRNIPNNPNSLNDNSIVVIYEAPTEPGILWIGTANGGLNRFDPQKETFVHYNANLTDPKSLMIAYVHTICEDRDGSLWIGTHGGGLSKLIRKKGERGKFIHYTEKHGLPNNTIYSILEDENDHLWISTNKGLSRFNPKTETFKNYYVSDGLQGNEFNAGAFCKSKSGEMFFGGLNGFNAFFPAQIKNNPYIPPIVITDFKILNKPVTIGDNSILKKSITWTEELVLSHKDYFFSFEFAALDFTTPEKNRYAFMMEGFDEDWIYTDSKKRFSSYTNLEPGEYIFRIKGSNNDEIWNEKGTSIKITITPPFWQTLWFKVILALVVIGLIFLWYVKRLKNVRIKAELQTAHDAQMSIMPQSDPNIEGLDISGICVPANEVGGDFFDYMWMNKEKTKIGIAIGDVSGKAMKSAMTAVMTSGMIYLEADEFTSVKEIMKRVNRPLYFKTDKKVFTALCLASIDLLTKNITFTNAGLYDPLLVSKGKVSELKGTGKKIPLGVQIDTEYHEKKLQLKSGNTIVFFTDGITESKNQLNEFYGYNTLKQLLTEMDIPNLSAKDIKNKIIEDVKNFSGSVLQYDDMTVVVVKVLQI